MMKELNFCRLTPSIICDQLVANEAREFMAALIDKFGDMSGLELNWYLGKVRVVVPKFGIDYEQTTGSELFYRGVDGDVSRHGKSRADQMIDHMLSRLGKA